MVSQVSSSADQPLSDRRSTSSPSSASRLRDAYGSPLVDEMLSMLYSHPQLYVDIACNDWSPPRKSSTTIFDVWLRRGLESESCSVLIRWFGLRRSKSR